MKSMTLTTIIKQDGKFFVSRCVELGVVSQGTSVEEAQRNLREAIDLYLEDAPAESLIEATANHPLISTLDIQYA